jgi:hypothetical protein
VTFVYAPTQLTATDPTTGVRITLTKDLHKDFWGWKVFVPAIPHGSMLNTHVLEDDGYLQFEDARADAEWAAAMYVANHRGW